MLHQLDVRRNIVINGRKTPLENIEKLEDGDPANYANVKYGLPEVDILKIEEDADKNTGNAQPVSARHPFRKDAPVVKFTEIGSLIKKTSTKNGSTIMNRCIFQKMGKDTTTDIDFPLQDVADEEARENRNIESGRAKFNKERPARIDDYNEKQKELILPLVDQFTILVKLLNECKTYLTENGNTSDEKLQKLITNLTKKIERVELTFSSIPTDTDFDSVFRKMVYIIKDEMKDTANPPSIPEPDPPGIENLIDQLYKARIIRKESNEGFDYVKFKKEYENTLTKYYEYLTFESADQSRTTAALSEFKEFDKKYYGKLSYFYPKKYILYVRIVPSLTRNKAPQGGKRSTRNRRKTQKRSKSQHGSRIRRRPVNIATSARSSHRGTRKRHTHKKYSPERIHPRR